MEININIQDYLSDDEIKQIAQDAVFSVIRDQFKNEADINRIISNLSYEYVYRMVDDTIDEPLAQLVREKVVRFLSSEYVGTYVFRRKNAWEKYESPAVSILDEELRNSRPLIRAAVEKHIAEYPFHELDRDEIGSVIWDVIMERILSKEDGRHEGEVGDGVQEY